MEPAAGPGGGAGLSIVTVCMNRREHLRRSAERVAAWPHHREHLVVDWSSLEPLRRADLPADPRLRLVRVEGESRWNLCRAYNFAIAQVRHPWILKLDADCWPAAAFDPALLLGPSPPLGEAPDRRSWFGSGPDGRKGQFLCDRRLFEAIGGFHELLVGYGFDDKELQIRLEQCGGQAPDAIPLDWLEVIVHGDEERAGQGRAMRPGGLEAARGQAAMRATRLANRLVAAHCPWGVHRPASRYLSQGDGLWRADPASVPQPPLPVAAELEHVQRMTFWGAFLAIPEVHLEVLPFSLFPPCRRGQWPVRWWHRIWWHSARRLLDLPVQLLVGGRELVAGRGRRRSAPVRPPS